jgi:hypothetical protein
MSDSDDTKALEAAMQGKSLSPFATTKNKKKPLIQRICVRKGLVVVGDGSIRLSDESFATLVLAMEPCQGFTKADE